MKRNPMWIAKDESVKIYRQKVGFKNCYQVVTEIAVVTLDSMDKVFNWLTYWKLPVPVVCKSW